MDQTKDPGTVLVTGAGRRLGRAIALDLASRGWRVGVHYATSAAEAGEVVAEIQHQGGQAAVFCADLADADSLAPLIADCGRMLGAPTCLINNAALFERDTLATVKPEAWQAHLGVNLRAPIFLTQAFARTLPDGVEGNVINLVDQKVLRLNPDYFSYTIAKAALWTATQMMAQALAPRIRVNAVAPGPVLKSLGQSQAEFEREYRATLLQRPVVPEDVLAAIRFLLETPSITGQIIALDAGQHLTWQGQGDA
jgi:NAD(P)-dependent dehydrogenase (short-subunit alcohol dehydrogenase family)